MAKVPTKAPVKYTENMATKKTSAEAPKASLRSPKVLCVSTMWLLGLAVMLYNSRSLVCNAAILASMASFNAWTWVVWYGERRYIFHDKVCAVFLFLCLCESARSAGVPFALTCSVPYFAGRRLMKSRGNESAEALVCHLTFRLIGWWWVWHELAGSNLPDVQIVSALVVAYISSCAPVYFFDTVGLGTWFLICSAAIALIISIKMG